jgi:hypothetical protein
MFNEKELSGLRSRAASILKSQPCSDIRFKLNNITIQKYMYMYIADAILDGHVHVAEGGGDGYDHESNTIVFQSANIEPAVIVHEATHAVIDATNPGVKVTKGTHEAAAYIAETLFRMSTGAPLDLEVPHLIRQVLPLAQQIKAWNARNIWLFPCPQRSVDNIIAVIEHSPLRTDTTRELLMDGIGDFTPRPPVKAK